MKDVCSLERFVWAVGKVKMGTGVGIDGFPAYLLQQAPQEVLEEYHADICAMLESGDTPPHWKEWTALLAMKKGEDPRELGRRRDLWLAPHGLKVVTTPRH